MNKLQKLYRRARQRGAPIIAITTADQPAVVRQLTEVETADDHGLLSYDPISGPIGINALGATACATMLQRAGVGEAAVTTWSDMAYCATLAPENVSIVALNAHKFVEGEAAARGIQGIANLRDPYAADGRCLVLLAPSWPTVVELGSDVYVIDDPLPTEDERRSIIAELLDTAYTNRLDATEIDRAVTMTRGLSRFSIEQTVSLSLEHDGIDPDKLRSRFIAGVNATPGLTYEPDVVPLDSIGGLDNFKSFARAIAGSRMRPKAVVFVDEIEKALGGTGDTSGVSQSILGYLLTWMEDHAASGLIALGPSGSGKSMSAKALGGALDVPTIRLDVGELKGSLVGQSEANCRAALKTLEALAGDTFWVATCNSEVALPPELRRRFKQGVWFFDLPTEDERETIWQLYLAKYEHAPDAKRPADEGWTGAEIKACCESAYSLSVPLTVAAQWIVPIARSAEAVIKSLRQNASGRYVSASKPGTYEYQPVTPAAPPMATRAINIEEN